MDRKRELAPRLEDYLETIYLLEKKNRVARVKDIAAARNVKMPTVSEVLRRLTEKGYITYQPYGFVMTTEKGKEYAEELYNKHKVLFTFLKDILGLPPDKAEEEGCMMEHFLSSETVERIEKLTERLRESGFKLE
ncbi:metal-dependent transcriptional regulator [Thermovibrio sp.]